MRCILPKLFAVGVGAYVHAAKKKDLCVARLDEFRI